MQCLIDQGIVEPFTGTPKCISPVQWVRKPSSTEDNLKLHLTVDLRRLNKIVERRLAMSPTVWDTFRSLHPESTVFAIQELLMAYFQVRLSTQAKPYFCFATTKHGIMTFNSTVQGYVGSSGELITATDVALSGVPATKMISCARAKQ